MSLDLGALLSTSTAVRADAEAQFERASKSNPGSMLLQLLDSNPLSLGLVLARQIVKASWPGLAPEVQAQAIKSLVALITNDSVDSAHQSKAVHAVVAIPADALAPHHGDLAALVQTLCAKQNARGLDLLDGLAEFAFEQTVASHVVDFVAVLARSLESPSADMRLRAGQTACSLLLATKDVDAASPLRAMGVALPMAVLNSIAACIKSAELDGDVEASLSKLTAMSETHPWTIERDLGAMCNTLLQIGESPEVSPSGKACATELLGSVLARRGASAVKDTAFVTRTLQTLAALQMNDDEFNEDFDVFACPSAEDLFHMIVNGPRASALTAVLLLAEANAGKKADAIALLVQLFSVCKPLLGNADWRARTAGLSMIGCTIDALKKAWGPNTGEFAAGACRLAQSDPHPRVRLMAAACLQTLLLCGIGQQVRKANHQVIVGSLVQALMSNESRDPPSTRCGVLMAIEAFFHKDALPSELATTYLDGLVQALARVLSLSDSPVAIQVCVMNALSKICQCAGAAFARYYDALVPGLKVVASGSDVDLSRAAMTCTATVAEAVGKERFASDATALISMFLQRRQSVAAVSNKEQLDDLEGFFNFLGRVAKVLGADFAPILPHVLDLVLTAARADLGIDVAETAPGAEGDFRSDAASGHTTTVANVHGVGAFRVTANVYAFQLRAAAIRCIDNLADSLGSAMPPSDLERCAAVVLPNIADRRCTSLINTAAAEAMGSVLYALRDYDEPSANGQPALRERVLVSSTTELLTGLLHETSSALADDEIDRRRAYAESMERAMRICHVSNGKLAAPAHYVPALMLALATGMAASLVRRQQTTQELVAQGFELDAVREVAEDIALAEAELSEKLVDTAGYVLKMNPTVAYPEFAKHVLPLYAPVLVAASTIADPGAVHNALCVFVDAFMYGSDKADIQPMLLPALLVGLESKDGLLRQCGAFGLGVCAQARVGDGKWVPDAANALLVATRADDAEDEDMLVATENVVAALGKLGDVLGSEQRCMAAWMAGLPLERDETEAQDSHARLCRLVLAGADVPAVHVLQVLALCLKPKHVAEGEDDEDEAVELVDAEVRGTVLPEAIKRLATRLGAEATKQAVGEIADAHAKVLVVQLLNAAFP